MERKSPSKHKHSFNELDKYKKVLKICLVGFVIFFFIIGAYVVLNLGSYSDLVDNLGYYTVVVDCGSSGTRVNVFKWKKIGSGELPVLLHSYPDNTTRDSVVSRGSCQYHCMQTEPGLDKFVGNLSGVRDSLEPLIQLVEHWVPSERHGETPIFVLATAGLRRLDVKDSTWVLDEVEKVVKEHSFLYRKNWIRILSGKEEAYYGWVALNYRMGNLGNATSGHTFGLLDLGGSSLQVVMEIDGGARETTHLMTSKLGSIKHQLLAYSLPSFGLNEAFDRAVSILGHPKEVGTREDVAVRHPCLSYGFAQNYSCHTCDWLNVTYKNGVRKSEVTYLVGNPNWERCKGLVRATAINSSSLTWSQPTVDTDCSTKLLTDHGTYVTSHFHALSGFFAVYNVLNLTPPTNLSKIWEKGKEICHNYWANFNNTSGNEDHLRNYCFRVPYMASLIEDALCVGDKELIFGPGDISWTLGAALVEGEYLWLTATKSSVSSLTSTEFISSPIFVFLLLASLLLIVYCSQVKLPMLSKKISAARPVLPSQVFANRRPR